MVDRRLTLIQAAELLGLSPSTLRVQIRKGKLHADKIGRDWHVSAKEVARYRKVSKR